MPIQPFVLSAIMSAVQQVVAPTTSTLTSAQVLPGISGQRNTISNAARVSLEAAGSTWCGWVTGTLATVVVNHGSIGDGMIQVSVDGGAYTSAPRASTTFTLFSGAQATRFVSWRINGIYGTSAYLNTTGTVMSVTGAPPSVVQPAEWLHPRDGNALSVYSCRTVAATTNWSPPYKVATGGSSNVPSVRIRGDFTHLIVSAATDWIYVSRNGGTPVKYTGATETSPRDTLIPVTSGDAIYNVWTSVQRGSNSKFAVSGTSALLDIGAKRRMDQFGDSITFGVGATMGAVDVFGAAAALGFVGSTGGISGYTIAQLNTLLDTDLPQREVNSNDVAILAIGRNNVSTNTAPLDSQALADYQSCINKLLTKGYGKVVCRGVLPTGDGATKYTVPNGQIQSLVAGLGNTNVVFVDTSGYPTYTTAGNDLTHPDEAGYLTLLPFVIASYRTALGLP